MTDYYWGIAIGTLIGFCLAICTLVALCVVAKNADEGKGYDK
jgi:F0F1-type ATP synthase assembly protein I